jgi:acyl carrier protein
MEIETELADYICKEIAYDRIDALGVDEPLLNGALDSTDVLRLVVFIEDRYSVTIADDELVPENFATVRSLATLISSKKEG